MIYNILYSAQSTSASLQKQYQVCNIKAHANIAM
nr:MAG TPA: hypothetical protein [Caudoviricetes sp.]